MRQFVYYIITKTNAEIISITRSEAIDKINHHFKDTQFYLPISVSVLDRLINSGKSNNYISKATKHAINDYYKTDIIEFIKNDKKQRTDDAMKKAINRLVNKLYYNGETRKQITETPMPIIKPRDETTETIVINLCDEIETNIIENDNINNEIETESILNDEIETENNVNSEIETDDNGFNDEIVIPQSNMLVAYHTPKQPKVKSKKEINHKLINTTFKQLLKDRKIKTLKRRRFNK